MVEEVGEKMVVEQLNVDLEIWQTDSRSQRSFQDSGFKGKGGSRGV